LSAAETSLKTRHSAWAAEEQELGERREYFFTSTQFCFEAMRPS
jgi:hypothetical protein